MSAEHRFEIDARPGPALEGLLHDASQLLVRVRMFNGPGVDDEETEATDSDVICDLRPTEARELGLALLAAATTAETQTRRANWWKEGQAK
jgi:hypothetical protein